MDKERREQGEEGQEPEGVLDHYRWHIHSWGRGGD